MMSSLVICFVYSKLARSSMNGRDEESEYHLENENSASDSQTIPCKQYLLVRLMVFGSGLDG
jgi:hypothetical protein